MPDDLNETPAGLFIRGRGSRLENETVARWNEAEPDAVLVTSSPAEFRKRIREGHAPDPQFGINEARTAARFVIPKKWLFKKKRNLSPAQQAALAAAREASRKAKSS
jgi:hypothetical protein